MQNNYTHMRSRFFFPSFNKANVEYACIRYIWLWARAQNSAYPEATSTLWPLYIIGVWAQLDGLLTARLISYANSIFLFVSIFLSLLRHCVSCHSRICAPLPFCCVRFQRQPSLTHEMNFWWRSLADCGTSKPRKSCNETHRRSFRFRIFGTDFSAW